MLAAVDFQNPMLWAILIGWIMSVVLHEFAHGIVGYWGGDYTIRERGGLTLNPFQYIDPLVSIALPAVYLLMGGVPLPGGATYIRRDLLRSRYWDAAVSLAGPVMNVLLFLACVLPLHPKMGWADYATYPAGWTGGQTFLAAMALLQFTSVILNLIPIPPLDGFQALLPFMDEGSRRKFDPPVSTYLFIGFFIVLWRVPAIMQTFYGWFDAILRAMGFDDVALYAIGSSFNYALFGK
jgi:Zn-dependent protease